MVVSYNFISSLSFFLFTPTFLMVRSSLLVTFSHVIILYCYLILLTISQLEETVASGSWSSLLCSLEGELHPLDGVKDRRKKKVEDIQLVYQNPGNSAFNTINF